MTSCSGAWHIDLMWTCQLVGFWFRDQRTVRHSHAMQRCSPGDRYDWETGNDSVKLQDCEEPDVLGGLNIKQPPDALVRTSLH